MHVERKYAVILVIVVAAVVALILLGLILVLGRSRFADESERFRYVSDLTSQWSRQRQQQPPATEAVGDSIDLRDGAADLPAASALATDQVAGRERR